MSDTNTLPGVATLRKQLAFETIDDAAPQAADDVRLACWMLAATRPWPAGAAKTMQALLDAHRDGQMAPATWRTLRMAAVALVDSADDAVRLLGPVAEAAAWPLPTSHAGLAELMRAVCYLRGAQAARAKGWTDEDEADAVAKLTRIAKGDGSHVPQREEIPDLFTAAYPVLGRRFATQLEASNAAFSSFRREVAAWLTGADR